MKRGKQQFTIRKGRYGVIKLYTASKCVMLWTIFRWMAKGREEMVTIERER